MSGTSVAATADQNVDGTTELEAALKGTAGDGAGADDEPTGDEPTGDEPTGDGGEPATASGQEPGEGDKPASSGDEPAGDDEPAVDLASENAQLRQQLREHRRQMALLSSKMDRLSKQQAQPPATPADSDDDDDESGDKPAQQQTVEPEGIEKLQTQLDQINQDRGPRLAEMVEMMAINPKFEDVEEVCTRDRFDDIFEAAAKQQVAQTGGDLLETQMGLELQVWQMANPYRYMYDMIKKYHPDFASAATEDGKNKGATPGDKTKVNGPKASDDAKSRGAEPAKSPTSAYDIPGGGSKAHGGWTAERIDELPEEDLHKVPAEVYEAYLRGDLDPVT